MIGVFDSGFGGLTILKSIRELLPEYDYLYLGDNARTPYGSRSFEVVYEYTWQAVDYLFKQGCPLVILACNTASAKALRSIQQKELIEVWKWEVPNNCDSNANSATGMGYHRVLGVIRPTVEAIGSYTRTKHIGLLATQGTVSSNSYLMEIEKLYPEIVVSQQACPMWVPLIENNEHQNDGADYFVDKYLHELLNRDPHIDVILLACTHYPLLEKKIQATLDRWGVGARLLSQGQIVAHSLHDYLKRHTDLEQLCSRGGRTKFLTTETAEKFYGSARIFMGEEVSAEHVEI